MEGCLEGAEVDPTSVPLWLYTAKHVEKSVSASEVNQVRGTL